MAGFLGLGGDGTFEVEVEDAQLIATLREIDRKTKDLRPAFRVIDKSMTLFMRRQFASSGAIGGQPWRELAPSTIARRTGERLSSVGGITASGTNKGGSAKPLWDTGNLREAWLGLHDEIREFRPLSYERGVTVEYAAFHQDPDPSSHVPRRAQIPDRMPQFIVNSWTRTLRKHFLDERPGRA